MKKEIRFRMTRERAAENGFTVRPRYEFGLVPCEIDTDSMTPAAAWIAEHITATYVVDEWRDKIGISAFAGFSMAERDRKSGRMSEEDIMRYAEAYGDMYTKDPIREDEITFPIYGRTYKRPEDVIERVAEELKRNGCVILKAANGDIFNF